MTTFSTILSSQFIGARDPIVEVIVAELEALKLSCKAAVTASQAYISSVSGSGPSVSSSVENSSDENSAAVQSAMQLKTMKKVVLGAVAKLLLNIHNVQESLFSIIGNSSNLFKNSNLFRS